MDEQDRPRATEHADEAGGRRAEPTDESSAPPDPDAPDTLRSTAEQDRATSLEADVERRTVEELARGADQGAEQPDYGREGS